MVTVDLHLHTTCSDGRLTPTELVRLCAKRGLEVIAITDHDSIDGIPAALQSAAETPRLTVIPGVELSTDVPGGEIHILGYFVDLEDKRFRRTLTRLRDGRVDRARRMVEKLNGLGIQVSWERVRELSEGASIGRPHIAQAMVEAGYARHPRDAFAEFIGRNSAAYVERPKLSPAEAVMVLTDNGALPVLAHPSHSIIKSGGHETNGLKETLVELKGLGLVGLEVYYGDCTREQVGRLVALADELDLIRCGGSDYHAAGNPGEPEPGYVGPPAATVEALESLKRLLRSGGVK